MRLAGFRAGALCLSIASPPRWPPPLTSWTNFSYFSATSPRYERRLTQQALLGPVTHRALRRLHTAPGPSRTAQHGATRSLAAAAPLVHQAGARCRTSRIDAARPSTQGGESPRQTNGEQAAADCNLSICACCCAARLLRGSRPHAHASFNGAPYYNPGDRGADGASRSTTVPRTVAAFALARRRGEEGRRPACSSLVVTACLDPFCAKYRRRLSGRPDGPAPVLLPRAIAVDIAFAAR
eukprot:363879-Chlamydomonas_euryale.AAC.2